ncbi:MAG TPA: hypothetical protein VMV81_07420 [Phycisphaerae bacterium]|nr:hypothetical protein [Phycisphaerae bacterium]
MHAFIRCGPLRFTSLVVVFNVAAAFAGELEPPPADVLLTRTCDPCDVNCDSNHDENDIAPFVDALLGGASGCAPCAGDLDGSGAVDGNDIQPFINCVLAPQPLGACCTGVGSCALTRQGDCVGLWLGEDTVCAAGDCSFGNLTAYRPQHGAGYFPFAKTAVAETDEESDTLGPGIRINAPGDADPQGEDDLIEVLVETTQPGRDLALRRSGSALRVWTTRTKTAGTEIPFVNDVTGPLPFNGQASLTFWVEWGVAVQGTADLSLEPLNGGYSLDMLRFHTFRSIIIALGGEGQAPSVPVDPNHGTFVVGIYLYEHGYDVFDHDESDVPPNGAGAAYDEVADAVSHRMVDQVSIFGYSHGGGSTYFLSNRLDNDRPGIGLFDILVTSYVDAVENNSNFDVNQELRRPPSANYHANQYQVGTLSDFFLDGGPVPNSDPPPTGLNVETTPWGQGATHFIVDDYVQVRTFIETNLMSRMTP